MTNYRRLPLLIILMLAFFACKSPGQEELPKTSDTRFSGPQMERDLQEIKADGVLKAIAIYNSTEYFLYRGEPLGFEYELLKELARHLNLELEMVVARNVNELFDLLNSGAGDIIASGLTITEARKELVHFTDYLYTTHQALVQRRPANWRQLPGYAIDRQLISEVIALIGDTVHIPRHSSYYERLINLQQEIGGRIYIDTSIGAANTDDLIRAVVEGEIDLTIADYNIAAVNQTYYPILDIETAVSFSQRIAWALRKNSPSLHEAVNDWIRVFRKKELYYLLYNKYFKNKKSYRRRIRSEFYSRNSGKISPYDSLIRQFADTLNWDWRLFASLIYQESRFDPQATSWAGALGLMQMMPSTASQMQVSDPIDPYANISGGTRYLLELAEYFQEIPDSLQRIKFIMAAYNCGLGHVLDAQRLCKKSGDNPLQWDGAVENSLLKMSSSKYYRDPVVRYGYVRGEEPYRYVRDIFMRFQHYQRLLPDSTTDADSLSASDSNLLAH